MVLKACARACAPSAPILFCHNLHKKEDDGDYEDEYASVGECAKITYASEVSVLLIYRARPSALPPSSPMLLMDRLLGFGINLRFCTHVAIGEQQRLIVLLIINLLQRGHHGVGMKGLCEGLGSFISDAVVEQAVRV